MRSYIAIFICLIGFSNSNAWSPSDKNKIEELKSNQRIAIKEHNAVIEYEKEISRKYPDLNSEIDINDVDLLSEYIKSFGFVRYVAASIQLINEFNNNANKIPRNQFPLFRDFVDINLDFALKFKEDMNILSSKIKNREIISNIKEQRDLLMSNQLAAIKRETEKFKKMSQDVADGRNPKYGKEYNFRELARTDVVAQVLNYASGFPEDGSGDTYFYPVDNENGKCVYKIGFSESNPLMQQIQGLLGASQLAESMGVRDTSGINSAMKNGIDLSKGDLKNVNFYKLQGSQRNKNTGVSAYLRYTSRVEGLPDIFECDSNSCNIDRLKRGWELVASKCKGTQKAF